MFDTFPSSIDSIMQWSWAQIEPYYQDLNERPLATDTVEQWLRDWTRLYDALSEWGARLRLATNRNTNDIEAEQAFKHYLDAILPPKQTADNQLTQRFLQSGLTVEGFAIAQRDMKAEAELFRETNLPLISAEQKQALAYMKVVGNEQVKWQGRTLTMQQLEGELSHSERAHREQAWRLMMETHLADREAINAIWSELVNIRSQIATNAGLSTYRDYAWKRRLRFDYTPDDCYRFHESIEQVVVPAAQRLYDWRRQQLGVDVLRPWDIAVDVTGKPALNPFDSVEELIARATDIFNQLDPQLGAYFQTMQDLDLMDVENRAGKAPGAFCTSFDITRVPYIFANAVGKHRDIITLVHECGHAFHTFESGHLPYHQQGWMPMEFLEVPSQAMELLTLPYLDRFYDEADRARATFEQLERVLTFWPYMAVVDGFQHWVYENQAEAQDAANCDHVWGQLWDRFMVGIDWSGLEAAKVTGWHRKRHIFRAPFYYVEYGMAYLGAVQVWQNARQDQTQALKAYRHAMQLGGTVNLPHLYEAANLRFAFDADTLQRAVDLLENELQQLTRLLS
ncbi:MAG: M3 family oligoendopeptidase [Anaerolineales bacterium]|nr:M3 family oligoendopeptidase [Anaerolineales bacterium]